MPLVVDCQHIVANPSHCHRWAIDGSNVTGMESDQNPGTLAPGHDPDELASLREEFHGFRIWKEVIGERTRYVARSVSLEAHPHTIVTDDLNELRTSLGLGAEQQVAATPYGISVPNIARMYNYWIGGKDHLAVDRQAADGVTADFPEVAQVARANRKFVTRAVRYVAEQGITQFIDVGAGLPAGSAVHEVAQEVDPAARVAYVDNDKLVLAHARALLAGGPGVSVVAGDMRHPVKVLASRELQRVVDLGTPVCLLLASVLHFLEPDEADVVVAMFTQFIAPGSYLVLSAGTSTGTDPALIDRLRSAYAGTSVITGRAIEEIAAWFTGLDLVSPGLVDVQAWRPGGGRYRLTPPSARIVGAVGRKPMNADHVRRPSEQSGQPEMSR
jgi:hypothetical protein